MAVAVEKWVNEPIIILKPDAQVSQQELIDAWFRSAELAQTIPGTVYRIVDLRSTVAPDAVVSMIHRIARALVGASVNPVLLVSFVGAVPPISSASNADAEVWFETLDGALSHIRSMAGASSISS